MAMAGADALSTASLPSTTRAELRSTERTAAAQHCSEQREEEGLDCRAHAFDRTQGFTQGWLLGLVLTGLFTFDSRNDANTSPGRRRLRHMRDAYADQLDSI